MEQDDDTTLRALARALKDDEPAALRALLDAGLDPAADRGEGQDLLMLAASRGARRCALALIPVCGVERLDAYGWNALHHAANASDHEIAEALLAAGADPLARGARGYTPLLLAIEFGARREANPRLLSLLLPVSDLEVVHQDSGRDVPAMIELWKWRQAWPEVDSELASARARQEAKLLDEAAGEASPRRPGSQRL